MNLQTLLAQPSTRLTIAFDRIYHRHICVSDPNLIEITPFVASVQKKLYGNHLMTEIEVPAFPEDYFTGKRTIDVGDFTFTVAQLYAETEKELYRLTDLCGYLRFLPTRNGNRDLLSRIKMYHNWLPISRNQLQVELIAMERRFSWTKSFNVAITDRRQKSRVEKCYYDKVD